MIFQHGWHKKITWLFNRVITALIAIISCYALAGPPFLTNDPAIVDYHHWELFGFATDDSSHNTSTLQAPAAEFNYGVIPNIQFHAIVPGEAAIPTGDKPITYGLGDTEIGLKYRFIQEGIYHPQVAIYPLLELATGDASRDLGNGRTWSKLPLWLQKSWGAWTSYSGGGYAFNSAPSKRNYPYAGWVIQRNLNQRWILGLEVFSQAKSADDTPGYMLVNTGGFYHLTKTCKLLFSVGHSVAGQTDTRGYLGIYWTGSI